MFQPIKCGVAPHAHTVLSLVLLYCEGFPTSRLEMEAVADRFDTDGDGYIDYREFIAALRWPARVSSSPCHIVTVNN